MTSILKNSLYIVFISLLFFTGALNVFAQSALSLTISPSLINIQAEPGKAWSSSIKVINSNDFPLTVYGNVVNFTANGEEGQVTFFEVPKQERKNATLAEWIELPNKSITVPAQSTGQFPFNVIVPEDAEPGGHFAAILIGTQPPKDDVGAAELHTSQVVSSLFFLSVDGDIIEDGFIRSFVGNNSFSSTPHVDFALRFENRGNVHLKPQGDIVIYNMWGNERGRIPVNYHTSFGISLPEQIRKYDFSWQGSLKLADIGLYKAEVNLVYGSDKRQFSSQAIYFWVLPVKMFLITFFIIFSVFFFITWLVRSYIKKMFLLAGLDPNKVKQIKNSQISIENINTADNSTDYKDTLDIRTISGPMKQGIDDMRLSSKQVHSGKDLILQIIRFLKTHKIFTYSLIGGVIIILLLIRFFANVSDSSEPYTVAVGSGDNGESYNSEEVQFMRTFTEGIKGIQQNTQLNYKIDVINRSGVAGSAGQLAVTLAKAHKPVNSLSLSTEKTIDKTVIIFPPNLQEEALVVSDLLGGVIVSAATDQDNDQLKILVGKDKIIQN